VPLEKVIDPNARPEKIAEGFKFTEGPVFNRRGYLLFSDIPNNRIIKWERGKQSTLRENSNGANGLTFDHQGRLLACETGRVTRTEKDGASLSWHRAGSSAPMTSSTRSTGAFTSATCPNRGCIRSPGGVKSVWLPRIWWLPMGSR
jgi:sugar lactone lactonase YvrE